MQSILEVKKEFEVILENNLKLKNIIYRLHENHFRIHLVGGCVRDVILRVQPHDFDLVTDATPDQIIVLFKDKKVDTYGKSFLVIVVDGFEITTYRKDFKNTGKSSECNVERVDTLDEDLARRDFTCNAMAYDPIGEKIVDPHKGYRDLSYGLIRFVGNPEDRIKEDYLRILRACRFVSKIDGQLEPSTLRALEYNSHLIEYIPKERINLEIKKAMEIQKASLFFRALYNIRALGYIFHSLDKCVGQNGGNYHNETIFEHNMLVGDAIHIKDWRLKLAGYLHDVGKPLCAQISETSGNLIFKDHAKEGYKIIEAELTKLKFSKFDIEHISNLILMHMSQVEGDFPKKAIKRFLVKLEDQSLRYKDWLKLFIADRRGNLKKSNYSFGEIRSKLKLIQDLIKNERMFSIKDLAINGTDVINTLNIKSGPQVGKILKEIFEDCLNNPEHNKRDYLLMKLEEGKF
jgi:tRNA nucleotidyltransferase (CCA-adding enzyme)